MYSHIIIIPYRDRSNHLNFYINNALPLLEKHLKNFKIIVVEQEDGKLFNRGCLINIGVNEYKNNTEFFIMHDVDMIPNENLIKKYYTDKKFDIYSLKTPHENSLGGVCKISNKVMIDINGFPNYIWGWGIEDRALYFRSKIRRYSINWAKKNGEFKILPHIWNGIPNKMAKNFKNISNIWRDNYINKLSLQEKEELILESGLNNIKYNILERKNLNSLIEIIKVRI